MSWILERPEGPPMVLPQNSPADARPAESPAPEPEEDEDAPTD